MTMMWYQWQAALSVALLIISFTAAKPTTQGTLVVSRSDDETTTPTVASEVTTSEPNAPVKLTEMDVYSKISLRYAHTAVVTLVRNPAKRAQETTFRMLLPDTAFISGFTMTIDGKDYKAYVKEKEEAKQIYSEAVSQGFGAAHIAAKARDSNHFTVTVNVEPSSTVKFNLTYEELLVRRNGVYNHAVNLHPGNLVPKMKVTVHIKESAKISVLRVPEIRTGNEIDAMENDPENAIGVSKQKLQGDREAIITFTPDLDEQRRLMQVYAEKSKESLGNHRYYIEDDAEKKDQEGVLGQFVVQYDVDRAKAGEILVNDGYFVHFFAPTSLPPLPKHVVFVLDTSGSMIGRKVEQLREAMQTILGKMHKNDYFSIVEFNSHVEVLDLQKADENDATTKRYYYFDRPSEPTKLLPPSKATPDNIAKAKIIVSKLEAGGGTNIASALDVAVDLIQKGVGWESNKKKAENQTELESNDASASKTTKDSNDTTKLKLKLEPIIIFLTDGDPTVGETDPTRITNRLTEKNYGEQRASIFTLAFGDADRKFLRKLSLRNEGFMRHIYEAADAALQLQDFYRTVSSPLVADVKFVYPKNQIKEGSLTKHKFRTYYAGSEVVVAGKIQDHVTEIQPQVLGFCGVEDGVGRTRYEISPKVPVEQPRSDFYPLERLWAYLTIKQLLDKKDALIESTDDNDKETKKDLEKKALDIALKYEMVTPLTSLVVVKPNDTKAVDAESVDDNHENFELAPSRLAGGAHPMYGYSSSNNNGGYSQLRAFISPVAPLVDQWNNPGYSSSNYNGGYSELRSYISPVAPLVDHWNNPGYSTSNFNGGGSAAKVHFRLADTFSDDLMYNRALMRPGSANFHSGPSAVYSHYLQGKPALDSGAPLLSVSADAFAYEEQEEDSEVGDRILSSPVSTTPIDIRIMYTSEEPSTTIDPLELYGLKEFSWATSLLDAASEALILSVNGTQINLKLTSDYATSLTAAGAPCVNAPGGGAGRCEYLPRCAAARVLSVALYETAYCIYDSGYAGVCCPEHKENSSQSP